MITVLSLTLVLSVLGICWIGLDLAQARCELESSKMLREIEEGLSKMYQGQRNTAWAANSELEAELEAIIVEIWGENPPELDPPLNHTDVINAIRALRASASAD